MPRQFVKMADKCRLSVERQQISWCSMWKEVCYCKANTIPCALRHHVGVLPKVRQSLVRSENTSAHHALRSPENVDIFRVAVQRSPSKLMRRAARQLEISRRSVQRILNSHTLLFPSKITVVRTQAQSGKEQRLRIATWATCEEYTLQKTSFSDEDNLDEINSKRNIRLGYGISTSDKRERQLRQKKFMFGLPMA